MKTLLVTCVVAVLLAAVVHVLPVQERHRMQNFEYRAQRLCEDFYAAGQVRDDLAEFCRRSF